jgi:hypothetical protein
MGEEYREYGEAGPDTFRERVESKVDEFAGGPEPGWEKMEQAASQAQQSNQIPSGADQANPNQPVPEDEQLQRPVGTESDSY